MVVVVVVLGFYVSPTAKVIRRRDLGLKSHSKDWRSPEELTIPGLEGKWLNHYTTEASCPSLDFQEDVNALTELFFLKRR